MKKLYPLVILFILHLTILGFVWHLYGWQLAVILYFLEWMHNIENGIKNNNKP